MSGSEPGIAGWVRVCAVCGQFDMHSVVPVASMVARPNWRCGICDASELVAAHVRYEPVSNPPREMPCPTASR